MEFWSHGHAVPVKGIVIDSIVQIGEPFKYHKMGFYLSGSFIIPLKSRVQISLSAWLRYSFYSWHGKFNWFRNKNNAHKAWDYYMPIDGNGSFWCAELQIDDLPYSFGLRLDLRFAARSKN